MAHVTPVIHQTAEARPTASASEQERARRRREHLDWLVDQASMDSFPASDPPSHSPLRPDRDEAS